MDLLLLGSESRKTRIRPRSNLRRDKYDMEDIDEFFEEDDEDITPKEDEPKPSRDNLNNVARKINFTDAEAASFDLSPISISSKYPTKKKSPLRSPLQEHDKEGKNNDRFFGDEEDNAQIFQNDISVEQDFNDDVDDLNNAAYEDEVEFSLQDRNKEDFHNDNDVPSNAPSLTKSMALGSRSHRRPRKRVVSSDEESASFPETSELISPPPSNKKQSQRSIELSQESIVKPSPLPSPPPDGLRRSKRTRIAPLAFWRNERVIYSRARESEVDPDTTLASDIKNIPLQEIKGVLHVPETNIQPNTPNSNQGQRSRSRSKNNRKAKQTSKGVYDYESDPEISGSEWFKSKVLSADVFEDPENDVKVERTVAWAPDAGQFRDAPRKDGQEIDNFKIASLFNYNREFTATGLLEFPFEGFKSLRSSMDCLFDFHVVKGLIEVSLNNDKFVVTRGCSFEIPNANIYGFKNIGQGVAKLFFVQTRIATHEETK